MKGLYGKIVFLKIIIKIKVNLKKADKLINHQEDFVMPFKYRLERVLSFRIMKKKEQEEAVKRAEAEVRRIQSEIDKTKNSITVLNQSRFSAPHMMMENYDNYIKYLYDKVDELEEEKRYAILRLEEEKVKLAERDRDVKILEKHKERAYQEYKEEERKTEMKILDEVAGVKHYSKMQERNMEELMEQELLKEAEIE